MFEALRNGTGTATQGLPASGMLALFVFQRPRLLISSYPGTDVETEAGIAAMLGARKSAVLLDVQRPAGNMDENMQAMATRWEKFRLLDPTYGPISASDRSIAREAGADILMHMRSLEIAILNIEEPALDLTIPD